MMAEKNILQEQLEYRSLIFHPFLLTLIILIVVTIIYDFSVISKNRN